VNLRITSPALKTSERPESEFADLGNLLTELGGLEADSAEYRRLRDRIVERCLPVADRIAHRYSGRGIPREDLKQVARMGLVKAVARFDSTRESEFLSFAVPTIMGEVRRHFRDSGWAVRVPRRLKDLHAQVNSVTAELSHHLGRAPTPSELATKLGVDRQDVVEALIAGSSYSTVSTDASRTSGDGTDGLTIHDTMGTLDHHLAALVDRESLRPLILALPDRERTILALRFFEEKTQSQIAERLGMSQMHVSRLLARTLGYLRRELMKS
jgi:RNA polymerase sigma-B factor